MKLIEIRLRNFRCYKDEICVPVDELTAIIGKNDSGKSSIFDALDIFFENQELEAGDVCVYGEDKDVWITCVFGDPPESLVLDVDHPTTLQQEHLLNKQGHLEIVKWYNGALKTPKLSGVYLKALHPSGDGLGDLLSLKNRGLKDRLESLGIDDAGVNKSINPEIRQRIWEARKDLLQITERLIAIDVDLETGDEAKRIWPELKKYLPCFALFKSDRKSTDQDDEAQDPMKAAVKEALKKQEEQLSEITRIVKEQVTAIANATVDKLREMDPELAKALNPTVVTKKWDSLFSVSLTDENQIPINKRGSGVRRLVLLNFFRAAAEQRKKEANAPTVIYAVEEPETCQHPDNQKMLMFAFRELAEDPDCQVLLSTHTPMLAGYLPIANMCYLEMCKDRSRRLWRGNDDTYKMVAKGLGVLPDNRVKIFVGVEGTNDINFLTAVSAILHSEDESVPDLGQMEQSDELVFFPLGGSNLKLWVNRLESLGRPEFHIYDGDVGGYEEKMRQINSRERCSALKTRKREMENYLHPDAIKEVMGIEVKFGDDDDVPRIIAQKFYEKALERRRAREGQNGRTVLGWDDLSSNARTRAIRTVKSTLNTAVVQKMTPALLAERDPEGEIKSWLKTIAELAGS
jgi:predicted ATPase